MYAKKNSGKKIVAMLLAAVLLIGIGVGGTLAWLMDYTGTVQNTFTVGNINIDLTETVFNVGTGLNEVLSAKDGNFGNNQFKIIPGTTQAKDPKVIVEAKSEDCYVFVEVMENNTTVEGLEYTVGNSTNKENVTFVEWEIAAGWNKLDGVDGVYYREYTGGAKVEYPVLKNDQVSYSSDLTKAQIDALQNIINGSDEPTQAYPSLTFKAYAVQKANGNGTTFTAAEAWAEVSK